MREKIKIKAYIRKERPKPGKRKSVRVRVKRWGGGTKTDNMGKLLIKKHYGSHLMYQTDSKNYENCVIVSKMIFPIKSTINMQNFIEINLFGKFGSFNAISSLHQTQNFGRNAHVYCYSNQLEPNHAHRIKHILNMC